MNPESSDPIQDPTVFDTLIEATARGFFDWSEEDRDGFRRCQLTDESGTFIFTVKKLAGLSGTVVTMSIVETNTGFVRASFAKHGEVTVNTESTERLFGGEAARYFGRHTEVAEEPRLLALYDVSRSANDRVGESLRRLIDYRKEPGGFTWRLRVEERESP